MSNFLFVVAHPDDEILGAGAFIHKLSRNGNIVNVCVLNSCDFTRYHEYSGKLIDDMKKTHEIIGVTKSYIGNFTDGDFGNDNHREIVEFIESAIVDCKPDYIFTMSKDDMNYDHFVTAECCEEAARYSHRGIYNCKKLVGLFYMNTISETEWKFGKSNFSSTFFAEVTEDDVNKKIEALSLYEGVIRDRPHPRSKENIKAKAIVTGSRCGCKFAEDFEVGYMLWS